MTAWPTVLTGPVLAAAVLIAVPARAGDLEDARRLLAEARSLSHLIARMDGTGPSTGPRKVVSFTAKPKRIPFRAEIRTASRRHRIPEPLIAAVIKCERNWNPRARSAKGARGLM